MQCFKVIADEELQIWERTSIGEPIIYKDFIRILNVIFIAILLFMQNTVALKREREELKRRKEAELLELDGQMILPDAVPYLLS